MLGRDVRHDAVGQRLIGVLDSAQTTRLPPGLLDLPFSLAR